MMLPYLGVADKKEKIRYLDLDKTIFKEAKSGRL